MPKHPDQAALIEVELLQKHTHDGVEREPGDKIKIDRPTANWLAGKGVVEAPPKPASGIPAEQTTQSFNE